MHWSDLILLCALLALALVFHKGLVSDGFGLDRAFAALFMRAKRGQTMSYQTAIADKAKEEWGCIGCKLLGWWVEKDHCRKTLMQDGPPTAVFASYRAGVLLFALALLFCAVPWAVGRFL